MNTIIEFFNSPWLHALGYTLLHSVWQAGLILVLVIMTLRFIPSRLSNTRYSIASIALLVMFLFSVGTFFYIHSASETVSSTARLSIPDPSAHVINEDTLLPLDVDFSTVNSVIQANMPFFLIIWISGTLLFSLRILTGLIYIGKLRQESILVHNPWSLQVQALAQRLQIRRWVSLAESKNIQAPIIIGYLKPIILIPIGMCSSLSTEELETIFLHELMHIRRNDYLINVIQSFLEAIFFFNPFVWIISGMMKREREHCCDDAVVQLHGNAMAYAHALTSLEEARLSKVGLSISLAENKNQLLQRIKRIMEKSVKNYSSRERIIPALLLVLGLICASWISTQTGRNESLFYQANNRLTPSDTIKKDKKIKKSKKEATASSKKEVTTKDEKSDQESAEKFEENDDVTLYRDPVPFKEFDLELPPIPEIPPIPPIEDMVPPMPDFNFNINEENAREWEEFGKEFEEKFKEKFGDFYQANEKDIQRMIEEAQEKVSKLDEDWAAKMEGFAKRQEELARIHADHWERQAQLLSSHAGHLKNSEKNKKRWEESQAIHVKEFEKRQKELDQRTKAFEENIKQFEEELRKELVKDGYLGKDEELNELHGHWHNGSIEINGKKIKASDEKKYNDIREKYFKERKTVSPN